MNPPKHLRVTLSLLTLTSSLCLASPAGKMQQVTSPDQVPDGLAKSDWGSIRAAYEAGRHAFQPVEGGWQARNPGQQWVTKFDGRGFVSQPKNGDWQWGLELKRYGFPGATRAVSGTPAVKAAGQRLTYDWDTVVQEWWVNDARGLEHGFIVRKRPAAARDAAGLLQFELAVRGSLTAQIAADGLGVQFRDAAGNTVINYSELRVWDADGKVLRSHFEPLDPRNPSLVTLSVNECGARYPLTIDPIAQQAYLKPAAVGTTQAVDVFGTSVAVSGDTVVVGAFGEDSSSTGVNSTPNESASTSGAAYVFVRSGTQWTQQAYLKPAAVGTTQAGDDFGISVAISGDTVVVGAWAEDSSTTGVNSTPNEGATESGAAYVFVRSGTTWTQQAYLKPAAFGATQVDDKFGHSVAVSGGTLVVGAPGEASSTTGVNSTPNDFAFSSGAAYVFVRSGTSWTQRAYLKPAAVGTSQAGDNFGYSVAISSDTVVVGAYAEDSSTTGVNSTPNENASASGAAYVFVRSGNTWTQQAYLKPATIGTSQSGDEFGLSVAVSDNTVVVGADREDSSTAGVNGTPNESAANSGAAYVFVRSGTTWTQQAYLKPAAFGATQAGDGFGSSVAVSGDSLVVGAPNEASGTTDVNSVPNESAFGSGAAFIFVRSGTTWTQQSHLKPAAFGTTQAGDGFGRSVAVSGDSLVVGASGEGSDTTGVNSTPNESASASGAAYVFTDLGPQSEIAVQYPAGTDVMDGMATIDFGIVPIGSSSPVKIFTVTNSGNAALTLTNIIKDGSHPGDFTVGAPGLTTVAPGASTTFSVTFSPTASGFRSAAIHIANNDSDENPFDIAFTGTDGSTPFEWARRVASTVNPDTELSIGLALDGVGNAYVTGWFDGTNDFGGITLTNKSGGGQDVFVAKYDPAGALQWARRAGGNSTDRDGGRGIGVDTAGNVYVTGEFFGTADFDGFNLSAPANKEFFLVKYDNVGVVQWARQSTGGISSGVYGTGLAVDAAGNSYAVGYADNGATITFGTINLLRNDTGYSTFLVKYDTAGTVQWAQLIGGSGSTYATKVAVDANGNVYVRGAFSETMTIGTSNLVAAGQSDMLIAKFNNFGALIWVSQIGGDDFDEGGVAVDQAGNVYVSGAFGDNPADFDGISLTNAGSLDAFVAKYNSSGVMQWARRAGGTDFDWFWDVALDQQGNIYAAGLLSSNAVAPNGSGGAMIAKYDPAGMLQWVHSGGGLPASPVSSITAKCEVDSAGSAFLAGWYRTATTFGTNDLQTQGYWNFFLTKLAGLEPQVPLQFGGLSVSNGTFAMRIYGTIGIGVIVDTSVNLTNWTPWQTNALPVGGLNLVLPMATNRQFFRARIP